MSTFQSSISRQVFSCVAGVVGFVLVVIGDASGMIIRELDSDGRHRRFDYYTSEADKAAGVLNNGGLASAIEIVHRPTFFAKEYDWSGYGWGLENVNRAAILVSPKHFITSIHAPTLQVAGGPDVAFTNANGQIFKYEIASYEVIIPEIIDPDKAGPQAPRLKQIGDTEGWTDLALVTLTEDVDSSIKPFRLLADPGWAVGKLAIAAGKQGGGQRFAGRDYIDEYQRLPSTLGTTYFDRFITHYNTNPSQFIPAEINRDEVQIEGSDSGNPWFIPFNGELVYIGSWFKDGDTTFYHSSSAGPVAEAIQSLIGSQYSLRYGHTEGDFDNDSMLDIADVQLLVDHIRNVIGGSSNPLFDLNGDSVVDDLDVVRLAHELIGAVYGDVNLDGEVGIGDLTILSTYFNSAGDFSWLEGDFTGDLSGLDEVAIGDLVLLVSNYGYTGGLNPVPVPSSSVPIIVFCMLVSANRSRSYCRRDGSCGEERVI